MTPAHSTKAAGRVEPEDLTPWAGRPVVLIAAVARNGVIGRKGHLPWHLPGDLAHFRRSTLGRPVIMGRRTFAAIGRPLPGRDTIVVSADPAFAPDGVTVVRSVPDAFATADRRGAEAGAEAIMVAGGASLYAATIARADRLLLTLVEAEPDGDCVFPMIDPHLWTPVEQGPAMRGSGDSTDWRIARWERRQPLRRPPFMAELGC